MPALRPELSPAESVSVQGAIRPIRTEEFQAFRELIYTEAGIHLADTKRELVSSRLAKRLRHLGFHTYGAYYDYLLTQDPQGVERREMINCLTTNKTDFFREPAHFTFLKDTVFPQLLERAQRGGARCLRIWSAGCSTGEEPYSIAMTLREHFGPPPGWDVKILASDIDTEVLHKAEQGVYAVDRLHDVPGLLRQKYFLRGTGANAGLVRVRPELQELITFRRINLIEKPWPIHTRFDLIFCRNVIIYFDRPTQQQLFERLAEYLHDDGYLLLGHSENLHWLNDLFVSLGNTIHRLAKSQARAPSLRISGGDKKTRRQEDKETRRQGDKERGSGIGNSGRSPHSSAPCLLVSLSSCLPASSLPETTIIVGEVFASREPAVVQTLLGSCVSACLFDPQARIGGMNHFFLPVGASDEKAPSRFGIHAMELLINEIMKLGGERRRLQAKVFGGACLFQLAGSLPNVGRENARFVQEFLATEGIPLVGQSLGGSRARKVRFLPHTGQALVKPLEDTMPTTLAAQEERYLHTLAEQLTREPSDNVTLF